MMVEVNIALLNIRKGPSKDAEVLRVVNEGQRFKVVSHDENWFCIQTDVAGNIGFVVAEYVTVID